jgi:hypothetical protein
MPLIFLIRTADMSYPILQGQCHTQDHHTNVPTSLLQHRYFPIQVSNHHINNNGEYYGCCNYEHTRIILVREMNFVHYCPDWDLYVVSPTSNRHTSPVRVLQLILVPYTLHKNECREFKDWTYIGSCRASAIRLDVEACVLMHLKSLNNYHHSHHHNNHPPLQPFRYSYPVGYSTFPPSITCNNEATTSSTYHWHLNAYMDMMVDESYTSVSRTTCLSPTATCVPGHDVANSSPIDECNVTPICDKENQNNHVACPDQRM